jgi:hypothetical protein
VIKKFFQSIAVVLFVIIGLALLLFFGAWFLIAMAIILFALFGTWAVGIPITIKVNGQKIGYVRWTKFYKN